jgi:transposase
MEIATLGIDLGKSVFHLVEMDRAGAIIARRRVSRSQLLKRTINLPPCRIGMEACSGAHYLGRALARQGHDVRLMPAKYVKPFIKANKNDYLDAEAIAEAVQRPTMRFVPIKTEEQLDLQALHRMRTRLVGRRTALVNQIRSFLLERGTTVRPGIGALRRELPLILSEEKAELSPRMRRLLEELAVEWRTLETSIADITAEIGEFAANDQTCERLKEIPGVGPIAATALVAAIGDARTFRSGRDMAAWLGLVPRQASTGGKTRLLGISKRGNKYLRRLLVHGAQAVLRSVTLPRHSFARWLWALLGRVPRNKAVVALANKLARIAWVVMAKGKRYTARIEPATA